MPKYPLALCKEISEAFISSHPRGWELVRQTFGIRDETLAEMFRRDQKLWNKTKALVKKCDKDVSRKQSIAVDSNALCWLIANSPVWRDFWRYFRQCDHLYTDEIDYLTFDKRTKPV
jgi:hypothetical protein